MSKTFKYKKFTGHYYCQYSKQWEQYNIDFDYEVEDKYLLPKITELLIVDYFNNEENIKYKIEKFLSENNLISFFADKYEKPLQDIFREEAMNFYNS